MFLRENLQGNPIGRIAPKDGRQSLLAAVTLTAVETALLDFRDSHWAKFTPD